MNLNKRVVTLSAFLFAAGLVVHTVTVNGQLIDKTKAPNLANEGINKSLAEEIGVGQGNVMTPDSSVFILSRDPFRAIRRGRQLFQRKFTRAEGQGPNVGDGSGDVGTTLAIGAGLADSCAACHGRPRGSAGFGGDVLTRPDSRDAPHLFGLGLKEMLADEITADLRMIRTQALADAHAKGRPVSRQLVSKRIPMVGSPPMRMAPWIPPKSKAWIPISACARSLLMAGLFPSVNLWWGPCKMRWAYKPSILALAWHIREGK